MFDIDSLFEFTIFLLRILVILKLTSRLLDQMTKDADHESYWKANLADALVVLITASKS